VTIRGQRVINSPWILERHFSCQDDSILVLDTMHVLGGHQHFRGTCKTIFTVQVITSRHALSVLKIDGACFFETVYYLRFRG
jgi:hypothetical protein